MLAFLKEKKATSPENAISISANENLGSSPWVLNREKFIREPFIKTNSDGKIWLNEEIFNEYSKKWQRRGSLLFITSILFIIISTIIYSSLI